MKITGIMRIVAIGGGCYKIRRLQFMDVKMKHLIFALGVVFAFGELRAQTNVWQPSPEHTQVPIWPGGGAGCAAGLEAGMRHKDN